MSVGYSSARPAGREHIPLYPKGFIAIRIVQLVLAVIILALSAWSLSEWGLVGPILSIFTALITIGITIYCIVVDFSRVSWKNYNYWAILALDILLLIFWLPSFALVATAVAGGVVCTFYDCYYMTDTFFSCLAVVAALGGAEFALFIISLAIHSVAVHRHRSAGLNCKGRGVATDFEGGDRHHTESYGPNAIPMDGSNAAAPQIAGGEKHQPVPQYSSAPVPQQQQQQQLQQPQQFQPQPVPQQQYAAVSPTPPNGGMYQPPASPQPYYPPQQPAQQPQQQQVSPVGGTAQFGGSVPAPHPGSYEAHGQPIGYSQQ